MTRPIKAVAQLVTEVEVSTARPYLALEHVASGTGKLLPGTTLDEREPAPSGMATARPGDVLFGKLRPYLAKVHTPDVHLLASTELMCLRTLPGVNSRWLYYTCLSKPVVEWAVATAEGVKMPRTNWEKFREFRLDLPDVAGQRAIADFLDRETDRIDALMEKKRSLIAKATERFRSFVHHVMTGGLSDEVVRRETGNDFLPRVPAHWSAVPLRHRWKVIDCKHRNPAFRDEGYPILGPTDLKPTRLDLGNVRRFVDEADYLDLAEGERRVRRGDIIYTRNASIGTATYVDTDEPFTMGQDQCLITSTDQDQLFLFYFLNWAAVDQLDAIKIGATFSRINIDQIKQIVVPVPHPEEQRALAVRLDKEAARLQALTGKLTNHLALLAARRQAIITAAVTGQMGVPSAT